MLILGLLLIGGGTLLVLASVFTAKVTESGSLELLGTEVGAVTLFLLGVGAGAAILWGLAIAKFGAKRAMAKRRESQKLEELSSKLDRAEAERRRDFDHDDKDERRIL